MAESLIDHIAPTEARPVPNPPCSGNWTRDAEMRLWPVDEATARNAHLAWPPEKPQE